MEDGILSLEDMRNVMKEFGREVCDEDLMSALDRLDHNKDGKVMSFLSGRPCHATTPATVTKPFLLFFLRWTTTISIFHSRAVISSSEPHPTMPLVPLVSHFVPKPHTLPFDTRRIPHNYNMNYSTTLLLYYSTTLLRACFVHDSNTPL